MKLTISMGQAREKDLLEGLRELRALKLSGDQCAWLDRTSTKILDEHVRYHKLRDDWLRQHGDKSDDGETFIIRAGDPRMDELHKFEDELAKSRFEVRIVKPIELPQHFAISTNHYSALLDAGLIKAVEVPEESE